MNGYIDDQIQVRYTLTSCSLLKTNTSPLKRSNRRSVIYPNWSITMILIIYILQGERIKSR
jgi:hypothetical protein